MIHLHSMLSSETNSSTAGHTSSAVLSKAHMDSFHGALSDAVSSTLEKFGIHPKDVNISITPANADPTAPASSSPGAPIRTAPPTPGPPPSTSESSTSGSNSTTSG